jgi:hypothetical protein
MNSRIEQIKEYAKIIKDAPYALKTYLTTYDNTQKKFVPLELFADQEQLIIDYETYNENITRKYRQAGVSTVTAAWVSKKLQTAKESEPERVLIIANKKDTAVEFANKIRGFLVQWPEWINVGFTKDKNSESRFKLNNGCEVKAVATSADALRGYTPTILIFDEAAFIEAGEDFWAATMASLSTGGKIILISTPNGFDPIYYSVYDQAIRGLNDFHITDLRWFKDPRYTKDLRWLKVDDVIHYMLNRDDYDDDAITLKEWDIDNYNEYLNDGYKPFSSWFEKMAKKFKYDKRKVAQEIECDFLGSGDSVIPGETVDRIVKTMVKVPIEKYVQGTMWQWREPIVGNRHIMGVDVSRGDSEDYSAINIIDFDTREQVAEYVGKIPPDDLAHIAYKWGKLYGCYIVIDITGGMGVATARKLQELEYKELYVDGVNTMNVWEYDKKANDKIPGINFNSKRVQIIASFEEQLRHGFIVRSQRLVNEINKFVYVNGRPDHMKGAHDDAIMSMAMAMYVGDTCFTQLKKNENANKAMLDSWVVSERSYDAGKSFYSYGSTLDSVGSMSMGNHPHNVPKDAYGQYAWLFGKPRR